MRIHQWRPFRRSCLSVVAVGVAVAVVVVVVVVVIVVVVVVVAVVVLACCSCNTSYFRTFVGTKNRHISGVSAFF